MDGYISLLDGDVLYVSDYIIAECIFPLGFKQLLNLSCILTRILQLKKHLIIFSRMGQEAIFESLDTIKLFFFFLNS